MMDALFSSWSLPIAALGVPRVLAPLTVIGGTPNAVYRSARYPSAGQGEVAPQFDRFTINQAFGSKH